MIDRFESVNIFLKPEKCKIIQLVVFFEQQALPSP